MNVKDGLSSFSKQELQAFAENVWTIDGPNVRDFGLIFTTRMMIVKLRACYELLEMVNSWNDQGTLSK